MFSQFHTHSQKWEILFAPTENGNLLQTFLIHPEDDLVPVDKFAQSWEPVLTQSVNN